MKLACAILCALVGTLTGTSPAATAPSVYPTGVTIYDPERAWNGYTVLSPLTTPAVLVIDMNGNVVKRWEDFNNSAGGPARVLPGGGVIAARGARPPHQESLELVQRDFAGNVACSFKSNEQIELRDAGKVFSARQHHDWQREALPAGYYSPGVMPATTGPNTLILTHTNHVLPAVADPPLEDDRLIEVTPDGKIVWEWTAGEHIDEMGFGADARAAIKAAADLNEARGTFDWLHINSATYLGPNRWFEAGDRRFAPNASFGSTDFPPPVAGPKGIVYGPNETLYVVDSENHTVRKIDLRTGVISTVVGTGKAGDGPDGDASSIGRTACSRTAACCISAIPTITAFARFSSRRRHPAANPAAGDYARLHHHAGSSAFSSSRVVAISSGAFPLLSQGCEKTFESTILLQPTGSMTSRPWG